MAVNHSRADVCGCVRPTACVDRNGGLYLVAVRRIGTDRDERVRTGEVSDRLDVAIRLHTTETLRLRSRSTRYSRSESLRGGSEIDQFDARESAKRFDERY